MRRNHEPSRQQRQPLGQRSIAALTMLSAPKQAQQRPQPWVAADTAAGPGVYVAPHPSTLGAMVRSGDGDGECTYNATCNDNESGGPVVHRSAIMSVMGRARTSSSVSQGGGAYANGDIHSAAAAGDMARVAEHLRRGDAGGGSGGGGGDGKVDVRDGRQWSLLHHGACYFMTVACLDVYTIKTINTVLQGRSDRRWLVLFPRSRCKIVAV